MIPAQRIRLLAQRLHDLGPRPLAEYLMEIVNGCDAVERLEVYARLPGDFISANGGDRLPGLGIIKGGR